MAEVIRGVTDLPETLQCILLDRMVGNVHLPTILYRRVTIVRLPSFSAIIQSNVLYHFIVLVQVPEQWYKCKTWPVFLTTFTYRCTSFGGMEDAHCLECAYRQDPECVTRIVYQFNRDFSRISSLVP